MVCVSIQCYLLHYDRNFCEFQDSLWLLYISGWMLHHDCHALLVIQVFCMDHQSSTSFQWWRYAFLRNLFLSWKFWVASFSLVDPKLLYETLMPVMMNNSVCLVNYGHIEVKLIIVQLVYEFVSSIVFICLSDILLSICPSFGMKMLKWILLIVVQYMA